MPKSSSKTSKRAKETSSAKPDSDEARTILSAHASSSSSGGKYGSITSALRRAIEDASADRLRSTLLELMDEGDVPELEGRLATKLLYSSASSSSKPSAKKRKSTGGEKEKEMKSRWVTCVNCHGEFDAANNSDGEGCVYHPGDLKVDWLSDVWADTNSSDVDDEENREEYPEGFKWSCCGLHGDEMYDHGDLPSNPRPEEEDDEARAERLGRGCKFGKHVAGEEEEEWDAEGRKGKRRRTG